MAEETISVPVGEPAVKAIREWILEKTGKENITCPVCGNTTFIVQAIAELGVFTPEPMVSKDVYPILPLACENCAHTLLFNAVAVGLVPPQPVEPEEESE
jgi:predicted nucleic-acid-binding Zn-ribbon protein